MPRPKVRHAKSLLQTSLDSIALMFVDSTGDKNDVEETCTNPIEGNGQSVLKSISNPFEGLPSACLVQIVDTLKNSYGRQNKIKNYSLLITPQTRVIDLECLSVKGESTAAFQLMQLAAAQCPQLTHLLGMHLCTLEGYQSFLPHFKNLQVLNVSGSTNFNNSCMQILGFHCQHLRELDVRCCINVTDDGIKWLSGQCKSIEELIIYGTKVTRKGVEMALRNLPLLKILGHWKTVEALVEMQKLNAVPCPKYVLRKLHLLNNKASPLPLCGLHVAAFLCPFLTKIKISMLAGVIDWELVGLSELENLSELTISMYDGNDDRDTNRESRCRITFDGGLAPLLKRRGNSLKKLKFDGLPFIVRLGIIVKYCPNLKCLDLNCKYSTWTFTNWQEETEAGNRFSKETTGIVLNQLEKLKMSRIDRLFLGRRDPPIKELLLLSTATLETLAFGNCYSITDNFLREIYQLDLLKGLKQLEFSNCDSVTKVGIDLFMSEENSLERLGVYECNSVLEEDILDWQERAKNLNWDLEVEDSVEYWSQFA